MSYYNLPGIDSSRIEHTSLIELFEEGKQTLIVGSPGSGKTTCLLYLAERFRLMGETILIRDMGDYYEYLSLCKERYADNDSVCGLIPEGCNIEWKGKGLDLITYQPNNLKSIFEQLKPGFNILFADRFIQEPKKAFVRSKFWSKFFKDLLEWKSSPGLGFILLTLIFDQFNDIAPGKGRYTMPAQEQLVNSIANSFKDYRRSNIRLIASTHSYGGIAIALKELFDCHIIKRNMSGRNSVPDILMNYSHLFRNIKKDECWFLGKDGFDQNRWTPMWISPQRYYNVKTSGSINAFYVDVEKEMTRKKSTKEIALEVLENSKDFMKDGRISYHRITLEYNLPSNKVYAIKEYVESQLGISDKTDVLDLDKDLENENQ